MHMQSGSASLATVVVLATVTISVAAVADAVSQVVVGAQSANADRDWRRISLLGTTAYVGDRCKPREPEGRALRRVCPQDPGQARARRERTDLTGT